MRIILTFALNAGLGLVLSLSVAGALGPELFGRYAVAATLAIVLATAAFEWLRLSATRFVGEAAASADPGLRASLDLGYVAVSLCLAGAALALVAAQLELGLGSALIGWVALAAIANGVFDYRAALARALFRDGDYLRLVVVRNLLSFALMVGTALWFRSAEWVLAMLAFSSAAATLAARGAFRGRGPAWSPATSARLAGFARYGVPIVAANLIYQAVVLLNRAVASGLFGYAAAGQISLPTDITIRLFVSVGAALDVFLFQSAVRRAAEGGDDAGRREIARNMTLVAAATILLALGWVVALPAFEALFVPARYAGDFVRLATIMVPGVLAFCLLQFALNPVFQLGGRTLAILWPALLVPAVDLALLAAVPASAGIGGVAAAHSASLVAALLVALWLARRERASFPPLRDLLALVAAAALAALAMWPARSIGQPVMALAWAGLVGTAVFGGLLLALDVAGLRGLAAALRPRRLAGS